MPNPLVLIFKKEDMQKLMDANPDKIVIRSTIEAAVLNNGAKAGVVKAYADAIKSGTPEPMLTVTGCPVPPCDPQDD